MIGPSRRLSCACLLFALLRSNAYAQPASPGVIEVAVGVQRSGRISLGGSTATETAPDGSRFRLFATTSSIEPVTGVDGRIGLRVTRVLDVEASITYAVPDLQTRITSDVEGAADVTAAESVKQIALEGSLLVQLTKWRFGRRTVPFVSGGVAYVRHLHEGRTLVQTGRSFHLGGGVNYLLKDNVNGRLKGIGLRADARAVAHTGGAVFDGTLHVAPGLGASLFLRF